MSEYCPRCANNATDHCNHCLAQGDNSNSVPTRFMPKYTTAYTHVAADVGVKVTPSVPVIEVPLLPGTEDYAADLKSFFDLMVWKLHKHRAKGYWGDIDLTKYQGLLDGEVQELKEALASGSVAWTLEESADVANTAMIIASAMMRKAVKR